MATKTNSTTIDDRPSRVPEPDSSSLNEMLALLLVALAFAALLLAWSFEALP